MGVLREKSIPRLDDGFGCELRPHSPILQTSGSLSESPRWAVKSESGSNRIVLGPDFRLDEACAMVTKRVTFGEPDHQQRKSASI
jgi:hypothetical protein